MTQAMMMTRRLLLVALVLVLGGCVTKAPKPDNPYFAPIPAQSYETVPPANGSIYQAATSINLYGDGRALRVGDVITVLLSEKTQSSKSASTDVDKSNQINLPQPQLFGRGISAFGNPLSLSTQSDSAFASEGSSDMSNSLSGSITVTVHEVRPNGLLLVKGEKWLTLNQGDEYIRVSGMVRARDVTADNTVSSTKLADARIAYSGTGAVHDSNVMGWLGKFFISPFWLF
ncbi:flagellar basal body L-ring protein FlgH [Marinobacterium sedimentorum]|uniref:flagellar basal body L-ring protein FlgH n=1 Tax=Marinobacterium sedimentorum TaxID=2927804 RepID=UPI0020C72E7D|nr:flagellar basal body L-ring protein FlgH [Marinobacterium sedimentorum]MCP8687555.1 flagellar basal body L-ring protein FlgH [Marinobacterium sedimentorum]